MPAPTQSSTPRVDAATFISVLLDDLRDSLLGQLAGDLPCFVSMYAGAVVQPDYCSCAGTGNCGMAYVRLARMFPSTKFPLPDQQPTCVDRLAAVVDVGTYRCRHIGSGDGNRYVPPTAAEQTNDTLQLIRDAAAVRRAIQCTPSVTKLTHTLSQWLPQDAGDCGGGLWTVTVALPPWV